MLLLNLVPIGDPKACESILVATTARLEMSRHSIFKESTTLTTLRSLYYEIYSDSSLTRNYSASDATVTDKSSDECEDMSSLEQIHHNLKHPMNLEGLNSGKFIEVELTSDKGLKHKYHAICNGK